MKPAPQVNYLLPPIAVPIVIVMPVIPATIHIGMRVSVVAVRVAIHVRIRSRIRVIVWATHSHPESNPRVGLRRADQSQHRDQR
jgi:hypothetical protein